MTYHAHIESSLACVKDDREKSRRTKARDQAREENMAEDEKTKWRGAEGKWALCVIRGSEET